MALDPLKLPWRLYFTILPWVVAFFGLLLASFINALMYRIDKGFKYPKIFVQPSHCEKCKKKLRWFDLIPVVSFLIYKGKCSQCGKKIFWFYPLSELVLGISMYGFFIGGAPLELYVVLLLLFSMSYFDVLYRAVPKWLIHFGLVLGVLYAAWRYLSGVELALSGLLVSAIISIVFLLINLSKKSFGLGDILIIVFVGLFLSYKLVILFLLGAIFSGALYGVYLVIKDRKNLKATIPFVPFLYLGFVISVWGGDALWSLFAKGLPLW